MITSEAILLLKLTSEEILNEIISISKKVNEILSRYLAEVGIILVDFKLEFGLSKEDNQLLLIDEISPDTCRFWGCSYYGIFWQRCL